MNTTDRAIELLHEKAQLTPELASNADERQLSNILCFRALEDGLHQRILALHHETSKRRMQGVVVLLDELSLELGQHLSAHLHGDYFKQYSTEMEKNSRE